MAAFDKVLKYISRVFSVIISIALLAVVLIICAQTFFRYVVFHSLVWSEEVSRMLYCMMIGLGLHIAVQQDSMVRVDIIDKFVSPRVALIFQVLYSLSGTFVTGILSYYNLQFVSLGFRRLSDALRLPLGYVYLLIEIGFVLAFIFCVRQTAGKLVTCIRAWKPTKKEEGESA